MSQTKILLAEDERHTRDAVCLLLENAGYEVLQTGSDREALSIIDSSRGTAASVDLLILDLEIGGRSGIRVLDSLRSRGDLTPAVVITGLSAAEPINRLQARGHVEVLRKPFGPEQLASAVSSALAGHQSPQPGPHG